MGFKCGIVGLPNVGKSTLFNALTQTAAAQAANYPFCTIEPNVGDVAVPDPRLDVLAKIAEMPEPERAMAMRLHEIIKASAPDLAPRTWYGMPAYAKDGKVVCFFQSARRSGRYE